MLVFVCIVRELCWCIVGGCICFLFGLVVLSIVLFVIVVQCVDDYWMVDVVFDEIDQDFLFYVWYCLVVLIGVCCWCNICQYLNLGVRLFIGWCVNVIFWCWRV